MPTDCNSKPIQFSSLGRQQVAAQFDGGKITSDAGVPLLREVARSMNLFGRLSGCLPDPRDPALIEHDQQTMLAQRILGLAAGWEDLNDHDTLRIDPLMQVATERVVDADRPLASAPTLCRLENRVDNSANAAISKLLVELFVESFDKPPAELILDFDATDDPTHGRQEGSFFHGYYKNYCFLPLYVFCGERLPASYLRPSNIDAAKNSRALLKLLVKRLRQAWPEVRIIFRGDSGFNRIKLRTWCSENDVVYVIGLAGNGVLERKAAPYLLEAQKQFETTKAKARVFGTFRYAAKTWPVEERVIVKGEHTDKGANPRYIVTNLREEEFEAALKQMEAAKTTTSIEIAQDMYDKVYCARGEMENRIKEQQLGLFADRTSCHRFAANQFRLLLSSLAYVLIETLRRTALAGTELAQAQVTTIRTKLLKIGAVVVTSVRRIVLRMSSSYPLQKLFAAIASKLVPQAQLE